MKKVLLIFGLLIVITISSYSQIQRTFLGCSFGDTKQSVIQKIRAQGYAIHTAAEGFTAEHKVSKQVKFGGYTWNFIYFKFYRNTLYDVLLCSSSYTDQAKRMAIINYKELKNKLGKKYSNYSKDDWGEAGVSWVDSKTGVICRHIYATDNGESSYQDAYDRRLNIYLWYYDRKTYDIVNQHNNNEL
jgi:hypothetical protein